VASQPFSTIFSRSHGCAELAMPLVAHYGEARHEAMLGGYLWGIYQMLGKLQPTALPAPQTTCLAPRASPIPSW